MYITSIASNEIFNLNLEKKIFFLLFIFFISFLSILIFFNYKNIFINKIINLENQSIIEIKNIIFDNNLTLNKLYNFPTNIITILLINYLFLTLIITVKITNIFEGPIRSKN